MEGKTYGGGGASYPGLDNPPPSQFVIYYYPCHNSTFHGNSFLMFFSVTVENQNVLYFE